MDQKKFRETLGLFSTGVIIACARRRNFLAEKIFDHKIFNETNLGKNLLAKLKKIFAAEFFGMTINSFSSLSLEPKQILFCIDNKSTNLRLFKKNRYFSLNVLSQEQLELAKAFALTKNSKKWDAEPYSFGKFGNPIFENSLGFFECKKHHVIKSGDHHIIIGEVLDFGKINESKPLVFYRGGFL